MAVALLTGFVDGTPSGLVGAKWYGYPLAWLYRLVIAPRYYPWRLDGLRLVLDVGFWSAIAVVIGLVALLIHRNRK